MPKPAREYYLKTQQQKFARYKIKENFRQAYLRRRRFSPFCPTHEHAQEDYAASLRSRPANSDKEGSWNLSAKATHLRTKKISTYTSHEYMEYRSQTGLARSAAKAETASMANSVPSALHREKTTPPRRENCSRQNLRRGCTACALQARYPSCTAGHSKLQATAVELTYSLGPQRFTQVAYRRSCTAKKNTHSHNAILRCRQLFERMLQKLG